MKNFQVLKVKNAPVICHIPHSSIRIPTEFANDFSLSKNELKHEALQMADLYSNELFAPLLKRFGGFVANFSRVVADVERFSPDKKEPMAKVGMGALYTRASDGKTIRRLTPAGRKHCLDRQCKTMPEKIWQMLDSRLPHFSRHSASLRTGSQNQSTRHLSWHR